MTLDDISGQGRLILIVERGIAFGQIEPNSMSGEEDIRLTFPGQ